MAGSKKKKTKKVKKGRRPFSAWRKERKRKKKMQAYLHGDVKIPPSAHGRLSVQIGFISLTVFLLVFVISYLTHGEAGAWIGLLGIAAIVLCGLGIFQGLIGFSEKKRDPGPCRRGIVFNLFLLIVLILMFFSGLGN